MSRTVWVIADNIAIKLDLESDRLTEVWALVTTKETTGA
jgi:hypothetical protein